VRLSAALVVLALATAAFFGDVLEGGISRVAAETSYDSRGQARAPDWQFFETADTTLAAWLVPRNARTLVRAPTELFDTEHCAPATKTLAFGEPMITLGALAIPAWLAMGDPIATYNLAVMALFFVGAVAMLLLVTEWTGSIAAGLAAALLYAFSGERASDITHPFVYDTAWIVLGLYFARRLFAQGRWRDALGLGLCGALQLGTSLYPILGALLLALPTAAWLIATYPPSRRRILQLSVAILVVLAAAYAIFSPYLAARATSGELTRSAQRFAEWSWFLPWHESGVTYSALIFALAAVFLARPIAWPKLPVAWALLAGALLAAAASVGPASTPDVYHAMASVLPGLDAVRAPARVDVGFHTGLAILAGLGIAELTKRAGRYAGMVGVVAVIAAAVETLASTPTGAPPTERFQLLEVAASADDIAFYDTLARTGDRGPLLELPIGNEQEEYIFQAPRRILLSIYHGRRTSACYGSFLAPGREAMRHTALALPDREAAAKLHALGFATVVVHLDTPTGRLNADQLRAVSYTPGSGIAYLATGKNMIAFSLGTE